ncbi:MAG: hypothetical protein JOZ43_06865, partial [Acidobacteriales bacterium]|nr:hypothetical protein [Terriglobales bacterium]
MKPVHECATVGSGMTAKPDYGIDAPGVIRNLALIGAGLLVLAFATPPVWHLGQVSLNARWSFVFPGVLCVGEAVLMLAYAKHGKFVHRDRMMRMVDWRGNEQVLDVGTGRGLLLVAAAARVPNGRATGIDVWNREDLSGNSEERTRKNFEMEGVADKCELLSA